MATIFIVNHTTGGFYTSTSSSYHRTEEDAAITFEECKDSVGEDPACIELIRLDTETLEATTITGWEGNIEDLEDEEDDDDWIVEGKPDGE